MSCFNITYTLFVALNTILFKQVNIEIRDTILHRSSIVIPMEFLAHIDTF